MKIKKFKGKPASMFALLAPAKSDLDRIVVLGVGDGKKLNAADAEKMGGTALGAVEKAEGNVTFLIEPMGSNVAEGEIAARAAIGAYLRDYKFETYKTKNKTSGGPKEIYRRHESGNGCQKGLCRIESGCRWHDYCARFGQ